MLDDHLDTDRRPSLDRLLSTDQDFEMQPMSLKNAVVSETPATRASHIEGDTQDPEFSESVREVGQEDVTLDYRVYKRRWFGLFQLVLLNVVVSWDWLTFSAVSSTASEYFGVSPSGINWLSTGFLFAFVVVTPLVIYTLNKGGPKGAIIVAAILTLVGNWIRYAGTRVNIFGVVILGQILIGFAQPFVLCAPTRYSDAWFSDKGRVSATAIATLANPLGGALGQLVGPLWGTGVDGIPKMVLYTAIMSSVASLPSFFIPAGPPTPPSASAAQEKLDLFGSIKQLRQSRSFFLLIFPFGVYVGFFNATSSLLNQIFGPYGFSETEAGIAGGILIVVGLIASAIVSPIIDRTKRYLITIKILVPLIAIGYVILIWVPQTRLVGVAYFICALIGAASFSLLPCALEYLVEITSPISPEVSSTLCWCTGQLLGAVFILIMDALRGGWAGQPEGSMKRSLVFQGVVSAVAIPCALLLGLEKGMGKIRLRRLRGEDGDMD